MASINSTSHREFNVCRAIRTLRVFFKEGEEMTAYVVAEVVVKDHDDTPRNIYHAG
jgi:hypothetical protein